MLGKLFSVPGLDEARMTAVQDRYLALHKSANYNALVTTQEFMFELIHEYGQPNRCEAKCEKIIYLGEGFKIDPIIVLRRQDFFL